MRIDGLATDEHAARQTRLDLQQQRQLRRCAIEYVQSPAPDGRREQRWIGTALLREHEQCRAKQQRYQLLQRCVERYRCIQAHLQARQFTRVAIHRLPERVRQVHHGCMADRHAFRLPGGTGRVDHVGQIGRLGNWGNIVCRQPLHRRPVRIQTQARHGRHIGQTCQQVLLRQQQGRGRIAHHIPQARGRIGRIERHIRRPCLPDRQDRHQHVHRPFETDAHQGFPADAGLAQVAAKLVGTPVQFRIAQAIFLAHYRQLLRRPHHLRLEQRPQRADRIGHRQGPAGRQQIATFFRVQHRQLTDAFVRPAHDTANQACQVTRHTCYRRRREQRRIIFPRGGQLASRLHEVERQVELGVNMLAFQALQRDARQVDTLRRRILQRQHYLEQR